MGLSDELYTPASGNFKRALRTIRNQCQNELAPSVPVFLEDHDWTLEEIKIPFTRS